MIDFHQLIDTLSNEQKRYNFPHKGTGPTKQAQAVDGLRFDSELDALFRKIDYHDKDHEFELVPSFRKEQSILISMINVLYQYPSHQMEHYLDLLQNHINHWMIIHRDLLADYQLNQSRINFHLNSKLDHEDHLLLLALMFRVNIFVLNMDRQFRLYSPINLNNLYVLFLQHDDLRYNAIKFHPSDQKALANLTGFISIVEPGHPLIEKLFSQLQ